MPFPTAVRDEALVACGRHCCLCHRFCGIKIELHHILQKAEGGENSFENCIPLCFDCHADMRSYDHKHPKGTKYTPAELQRHRDAWYAKVKGVVPLGASGSGVEQDRETLRGLMQALPYRGIISFIEAKDFGAPFRLEQLNPLDEFVESASDPSCEFLDSDLEGLRAQLVKNSEEFRYYLSTHTWPMDDRRYQAVPREWEDRQPERFVATIDRLNALSREVVAAYVALVREGRRRLGA